MPKAPTRAAGTPHRGRYAAVADQEPRTDDGLCRDGAAGAPLVARWHKRFAHRLAEARPLSGAERDECFGCFDTEDFRIGYAAFLAKRKPRFNGR